MQNTYDEAVRRVQEIKANLGQGAWNEADTSLLRTKLKTAEEHAEAKRVISETVHDWKKVPLRLIGQPPPGGADVRCVVCDAETMVSLGSWLVRINSDVPVVPTLLGAHYCLICVVCSHLKHSI